MGVTTSKPKIGFLLQLLFNKHHIRREDVELTRTALALFSCPCVEDGLSLKTKQFLFHHHDSNFADNKKVVDYLINLFIKKCSPNTHINIDIEDNAVRIHPDGRRADGLYPDGRRADGLDSSSTVNSDTQVSEMELKPTFKQNIENWFHSEVYPNIALFQTKQLIHDVSHSVLVLLVKAKTRVECIYIDSLGAYLKQSQLFCTAIEQFLGVQVVGKELPFCPLQSNFQNGNCKQWTLLFMLCILCNPQFVREPELLVQVLNQNADMNILLFELYLFFVGDYIVKNYKQKLEKEFKQFDQVTFPERGLELILSREELTPCFYKGRSLQGNSIQFLYEKLTRLLPVFQRQKVFILEHAGLFI